jgi:hypothetical protein
MQLALDVSNYSGIFGSAAVACWRGLGYEHLVCGTQRPEITVRPLRPALSRRGRVEAIAGAQVGL